MNIRTTASFQVYEGLTILVLRICVRSKDLFLILSFTRELNFILESLYFVAVLVIVPRSSKTNQDEKLVYLGSPLIQAHLGESWFYDMKTASHPCKK